MTGKLVCCGAEWLASPSAMPGANCRLNVLVASIRVRVAEALADTELAICNAVPTGTYVDMCANLPVCDPTKVQCPVLIIRGEHDGVATETDLLNYFTLLPNRNKQFAIIAGQAHVSHLGVNRARFWHVMLRFLEMPPRKDSSGL